MNFKCKDSEDLPQHKEYIKYVIETNFICYFDFSYYKYLITYVADILFWLDSTTIQAGKRNKCFPNLPVQLEVASQ